MRRMMGGLRGRGAESTQRYKMREKLISIGDDYWIENEHGEKAFYVDGKAIRVRDTLIIKDVQGNEKYKLKEKLLRVRDTMSIQDAGGGTVATVKKALITPLRDRWKVDLANGSEMKIHGNILNHEYKIDAGREKVAEVSKKWFRVRDTYGVEVSPGQDDALVLAITVAVDQMAHG
ncbi:hypothetical protein MSMTP_1344 [Methanosarcina sp. MTP4]|uniref:LURP-one-related/scramblase family protein n=1 Tax=Methanosarcina sp. MTP4 TaxID=1434100 RepID=UPI000615C844|nr:LURP-one-related family protein [Methanosarcina sp. MTP4]AKB24813.1 hypothetical protein MSMTP_1344 [Methanosarcina sp. MTP4]